MDVDRGEVDAHRCVDAGLAEPVARCGPHRPAPRSPGRAAGRRGAPAAGSRPARAACRRGRASAPAPPRRRGGIGRETFGWTCSSTWPRPARDAARPSRSRVSRASRSSRCRRPRRRRSGDPGASCPWPGTSRHRPDAAGRRGTPAPAAGTATPTEAPTESLTSSTTKGSAVPATTRQASRPAPASGPPVTRTANSSPPRRASRSPGRSDGCNRRANASQQLVARRRGRGCR